MTIQEQLNAINETFFRLHRDFERFEAEKQALSGKIASEYASIAEKWDRERNRISAVKEDVLKYYRIAKENSPKELITSGVAGQRPDIARLNHMIEQINPYNRNDPVAGQIIDSASQYVVYLDRELAQIDARERAERSALEQGKIHESNQLTQRKNRFFWIANSICAEKI